MQTIIKTILPIGKLKRIWALLNCSALFFIKMSEDNKEELRPSKMRGVTFPKAKYGVIAAIIIIVVVNLIYYKDFLVSLIK